MTIKIDGKELKRNAMFYDVDVDKIEEDPGFNMRTTYDEQDYQELKAFIRESGVPGSLLVYKDGNRVVLVDGHNRLRAIKELNAEGCALTSIPVEFERANQTETERLVTAYSRNKSAHLSPLDEAGLFRRFVAWRWSHQQIATRVGKSVSYVTQRLALLEASPELHTALSNGTVTPTEAVQIVRESRHGATSQAALLAREPASKEEKALKSFTKSLDKIGLDEAITAFITYAKQEELEYLIEPFTFALKAHKHHTQPAAKKGYIGDE
jgi:ParB/RepB/Spo0J family partition protein